MEDASLLHKGDVIIGHMGNGCRGVFLRMGDIGSGCMGDKAGTCSREFRMDDELSDEVEDKVLLCWSGVVNIPCA